MNRIYELLETLISKSPSLQITKDQYADNGKCFVIVTVSKKDDFDRCMRLRKDSTYVFYAVNIMDGLLSDVSLAMLTLLYSNVNVEESFDKVYEYPAFDGADRIFRVGTTSQPQ
jgi:hypothetical protein